MTRTPNDPKRHHYVPCVLLSRFGLGEGRDALIHVWDKATGKVRLTKVNDAAFENDLHRIPDEDYELLADSPEMHTMPERYQGVLGMENLFADMEGMFGEVLAWMTAHVRLPDRDSERWQVLLSMFSTLSMRTPARLEEYRVMAELTEYMSAQLEINRSDEPNREAARPVVPYRENRHILLANTLRHAEPLAMLLAERNWSLLTAPMGSPDFIITDYPVACSFARKPLSEFDCPAPAVRQTMATLPLARNLLLVGEYEVPSGVRLADSRWVGYHNNVALTGAERFLFTHGDTFVCLTDYVEHKPAYASVHGDAEALIRITPDIFRQMYEMGALKKPVRMTVNGALPQDYRLE